MPYNLDLPEVLRKAGWKVKIYDREGPEEPHVTIRCKTKTWRMSLRDKGFLFPGGRRSELPDSLLELLGDAENWAEMRRYWDDGNPHNPVEADQDDQNN